MTENMIVDEPIEPSVEKRPTHDRWSSPLPFVDQGSPNGDYTAETIGHLDKGKFVIDSFNTIPATDHDALEAQLTSELADGVEKLLSTREATHGDYANTARVAQILKRILTGEMGDEKYTDRQRESLDLICTKLARIVSGNANEPDHWRDIAGYATLAIDE